MKPKVLAFVMMLLVLSMMALTACGGSDPTAEAPAATDAPESDAAEPVEAEPEEAEPAEEEMAEEEMAEPEEEAAAEEETAEEPAEEEMAEEEMAAEGSLPAVISFPDQIANGEPVEITVVQMPAESQPEALAAWQEQVARFQEMYPNVTIVGTDYAYAPDSFAALVAGNQVPTLFEVYLTDPAKMIEQGIATDLTTYFEDQNLTDVFNPDILAITSDDEGHIYGIPRFAYAMGLAYDMEKLAAAGYDAPPATWEELAEMAQAMTDRDNGVAGFSFITDGSGATGWHMTTIAYNFGLNNEDIVADTGDGYAAGYSDGAMLDAMNYVDELRWTYDVLPRENLDWGTNGEALATGRAAMIVMAGDQYTWIRQTYPDAPIEQFAFAPLPSSDKSVSLVGGNIGMISSAATPEEAEAAVYWRLFTQFDPDEIIANYEAGKTDPTVVVGSPTLPLYVGDYQAAVQALEAAYANMPVENYAAFLNAISSGEATLQPEPLVAGQEYYSALGTVVSTIITDEGADPAATLQESAEVFQTNVLDQLQ